MKIWIIILVSGLFTFLLRFSFVKLFENWAVPGWLQRVLRFVPAAALSALIFPSFFYAQGAFNLTLQNDRLIAGLVAAIVAYRSKNILWTLITGMGVLWVLGAV